jgi:hypothetical protein
VPFVRAGRSLKARLGFPAIAVCAPDAVASTASHRAFVTTRDPPLSRVGRRELVELICPTMKAKYFCHRGWTAFADLPDSLSEVDCQRSLGSLAAHRLRTRVLDPVPQQHRTAFQDVGHALTAHNPAEGVIIPS